jgi:hypothetical protein
MDSQLKRLPVPTASRFLTVPPRSWTWQSSTTARSTRHDWQCGLRRSRNYTAVMRLPVIGSCRAVPSSSTVTGPCALTRAPIVFHAKSVVVGWIWKGKAFGVGEISLGDVLQSFAAGRQYSRNAATLAPLAMLALGGQ